MNWYTNNKHDKLIKSASSIHISQEALTDDSDGAVADTQGGRSYTLYDVQRYVMDSYSCKTAFTKTNQKLTVTLLINHNFLGSIAWDAYWSYGLDEFDRANSMYKRLNTTVKETAEEFIAEETPTSLFWPMLRSKLEMQDKGNQAATNIPSVNYARDIPIEPDWRRNIYGPRYPDYKEPNYNQQVKFWATQRD